MVKDKRITELYHIIDSGKYDLLSLDIFDTTVWRMVPNPVEVFFLLGRDFKHKGLIRESSSAESFARERIRAEERSRKKKLYCTEVTLEEIYAQFPKGYLSGCTSMEAAELEFQKECQLVRVYPEMAKLISYAGAKGLKTAFVSDTYFNQGQIDKLLGFNVDFTILSSEHNVSKYHGLHSILLDQSGVPSARILHVGDNHRADIEGPQIYPIDTYWFEKFPEPFDPIIDLETPKVSTERSQILKGHDQGLTWHRSLAASALESDYEKWGALVLGPLMLGFADWVVNRCKKENIHTVLCLMREGRIFKKVIDICGTGLDTKELFISRYAALKAAIFKCSPEELKSFVFRPSNNKAGVILSQLGLCGKDVDIDEDQILTPKATLDLIKKICDNQKTRQKVIQSSRTARKNLLKHLFEKLDPHQKQIVGIVDLGYKGTIQENLQRILDHEELPLKTHGLYLVTGGDVYQTQSSGAVAEGWLVENNQPLAMAHTFMRSPEIIEQSLMADCGTTLGHDESGAPILDGFIIPEQQRAQIIEIQQGMDLFCRKWVKYRNKHGYAHNPKLKAFYQNICMRAVSTPMKIELTLFGEWEHDENFGSDVSRKLTHAKLNEWQLKHISPHQLASLPSSKVYWPFGLAYQMDEKMGEAVSNIYLRRVQPEVFDSCDEQVMIFYWDSGSGFNRDECEIVSFRVNNRSKAWKRFNLNLEGARSKAVAFSVGKMGDLLQLTGVELQVESQLGDKQKTMFDHNEIEIIGYQHLGNNFYLVNDDSPLLAIPTGELNNFTGSIRSDLFFTILAGQ